MFQVKQEPLPTHISQLCEGLSQSEVAQRMGTTQSVVARLESGERPPSMRTVERFAQAVGGYVVFRIEAVV
jgi:transcriptional regulator with XRE-family HTH domain